MIGDTVHVWATKFIEFFELFLLLGLITTAVSFSISYALTGTTSVIGGFGLPSTGLGAINIANFLVAVASIGIINAVVTALFTGAAAHMAFHSHRRTPVGLSQALSEGAKRFLSVLGAGILLQLLLLALFVVPLALIILGFVTRDLVLLGTGFLFIIAAIPVGIFLFLSLAIYAPVIMIEGSHAIDSLKRSWGYMRGHRLSFLGADIVIVILLGGAIGAAISVIAIVGAFSRNAGVTIASSFAATVISTAITGSLGIILASVAYSLIRMDEDAKRQYPGYYGMPGAAPAPSAPIPPAPVPPSTPPPANPPPPPAGP